MTEALLILRALISLLSVFGPRLGKGGDTAVEALKLAEDLTKDGHDAEQVIRDIRARGYDQAQSVLDELYGNAARK